MSLQAKNFHIKHTFIAHKCCWLSRGAFNKTPLLFSTYFMAYFIFYVPYCFLFSLIQCMIKASL